MISLNHDLDYLINPVLPVAEDLTASLSGCFDLTLLCHRGD